MANNVVQVKRTSTSGRTPNTTGSYATNSQYISAGELALNMADGILYSSNGSAVITVGANLVNQNISGNLTVKAIIANNSLGTAGQLLTSNGSATYWSSVGGTVTSVATGNGMTGGPVTTSGTVSVLANTGIVANATGVFVNATYIGTIASNSATYANSSVTNTFTVGTASYFVANGNLGIGTNAPSTKLTVNPKVADDNSIAYDSNTVYITHQTPTSTTTLNDPKPVLLLARQGTSGQAYGAAAEFNLSRYENVSVNSRTRLDIRLADGNFLTNNTTVLTALSSGNVGIGNTTPNARLAVTGAANVSGNVAIAGITTFTGNVVLGSVGLSSNGSFGTAGHVLHSNGTATYWAADDNSGGTVTSVGSANGIGGGTITTSGTLYAVAGNSTVFVNASGIHVNTAALPADGVTSVASGNGILGGTITSTGTLYVDGANGISVDASGVNVLAGNSTVFVNASGIFVNTSALPADGVTSVGSANGIGGGTITSTGTLYAIAGNSTVFVNASGIHVNTAALPADGVTSVGSANGIGGGTITATGTLYAIAGNSTVFVNASGIHVNTAALPADGVTSVASGNGILGGTITSTGTLYVDGANGISVDASGVNVLAGNSTVFVNASGVFVNTSALPADGVTSVATGNGLAGGPITSTGTVSVLANTGIVANATGVYVNATYIGTLTANNANNLNGQPASYYTNATNLASGTVPTARLGSGTANSTTYLAGDQTWKTISGGSGTVTSVATGNGMTGGTITTTGTVSVLANTGIVANATGVFVNAAYINTISSNTANWPIFSGDAITKSDITTRTESGIYEYSLANTALGWPVNSGNWQHLISATHTNDGNYYAMQIAGSFFDNDFYGRKTNGSGATGWSKFWTDTNDGSGSGLDADLLDGQQGAYYTNATNITTGTLPYAQIPANVINTTAAFTRSGITTFSANIVLGSSGVSANGTFGSAGHVLHTNGTATYWAADDNSGGTVISVATGNGLTGGTITTTGTLSVTAANGIAVTSGGVAVRANNGIVSNTSGVFAAAANGITVTAGGINVLANTGVVANATGVHIGQAVGTTSSVQFGSLGVGTAASGTTGEIRANNNITAYFTSDARLKENIKNIDSPIEKIKVINGVEFDWNENYIKQRGGEDGYFIRKRDVGVIAQEIEKVLPEVVATKTDGIKAVKYDRIVALLIEAVKEQQKQIEELQLLINK